MSSLCLHLKTMRVLCIHCTAISLSLDSHRQQRDYTIGSDSYGAGACQKNWRTRCTLPTVVDTVAAWGQQTVDVLRDGTVRHPAIRLRTNDVLNELVSV
jgi:hypothetical protein